MTTGGRKSPSLSRTAVPRRSPWKRAAPPHRLAIARKGITWIKLGQLIKADDPSPFPALTQFEVWGWDSAAPDGLRQPWLHRPFSRTFPRRT